MTRDQAIQFLQNRPADEPVLILSGDDPLTHIVSQQLVQYCLRLNDPAAAEQFQQLDRQMVNYRERLRAGL